MKSIRLWAPFFLCNCMQSRQNFGAALVSYKKVLLHCIAFCQRMTVTIAHAKLNCVCTDTEVTTLVEYLVPPTVKESHHKQMSICSVTRTCL